MYIQYFFICTCIPDFVSKSSTSQQNTDSDDTLNMWIQRYLQSQTAAKHSVDFADFQS